MIALIMMGAAFLSLSMGFTGLPRALAAYIDGLNLSPITLIAALTVFYIILGMFLDGISSVVLTMAIVEPMIRQAGIDPIWFGIFIVVVVETALPSFDAQLAGASKHAAKGKKGRRSRGAAQPWHRVPARVRGSDLGFSPACIAAPQRAATGSEG